MASIKSHLVIKTKEDLNVSNIAGGGKKNWLRNKEIEYNLTDNDDDSGHDIIEAGSIFLPNLINHCKLMPRYSKPHIKNLRSL